MKTLKTLEEQRMFLKAVGTVLANEDIGLIKDSCSIEYGSDDMVSYDFKIGFSGYMQARFGQKVVEECKKLGLE